MTVTTVMGAQQHEVASSRKEALVKGIKRYSGECHKHGDSRDSAPSIDRIIGEFGYVKGNVSVISHRANKLKSDATLEEMRLILAHMEKYIAG